MVDFSIVAIFCEDIRFEKSGQETIVGVISDNVKVPAIPIEMPKIGIFIRSIFSPGFSISSLSFSFVGPDGAKLLSFSVEDEILKRAFNEAIEENLPFVGLKSVALGGVSIQAPGRYTVYAYLDGAEYICGQLRFFSDEQV